MYIVLFYFENADPPFSGARPYTVEYTLPRAETLSTCVFVSLSVTEVT